MYLVAVIVTIIVAVTVVVYVVAVIVTNSSYVRSSCGRICNSSYNNSVYVVAVVFAVTVALDIVG